MLSELCADLRNYFVEKIYTGNFTISGGNIAPLDFIKEGQYFRIVGSTLNDGVYQYPAVGLADEQFVGAVWAMNVPPSFIALAAKIKEFNESEAGQPSNYTSESFGGYNYSKATNSKGVPLSWKEVFASDLKAYRRISIL